MKLEFKKNSDPVWHETISNNLDENKPDLRTLPKFEKLPQDYTSHYSEMHGEPKYKNAQHEKAMNAPINEDKIRKAGW